VQAKVGKIYNGKKVGRNVSLIIILLLDKMNTIGNQGPVSKVTNFW